MSYINSVSSKKEEKFAFLFAGPQGISTINYNKDIENMYNTLTTYYNYDPANIYSIYGGTAPAIAGASPVGNKGELLTEINDFVTLVDTFVNSKLAGTADFNRSVVLFYFTGQGSNDSLIVGTDSLNSDDLGTALSSFMYTDKYDVNLIMQQDNGVSFRSNINAYISLVQGANIFVNAGVNTGGANGSNYTDQYCRALQFESLLVSMNFADMLASGETNMQSLLISLKQAHLFANSRLSTTNPNYQTRIGTDPIYLGMPEFLIQDSPAPAWWESEDIYLTHPAGIDALLPNPLDYYAYKTSDPTGVYNYVNVIVRNTGTHPIRQFDVGVFLYDSGPWGPGTPFRKTNQLIDTAAVQSVLIPVPVNTSPFPPVPVWAATFNAINSALTTWGPGTPIPFATENHRCMQAKAVLSGLTDSDLTVWTNLTAINNIAQRNLDVTVLSARSRVYKIHNPFLKDHVFYLVLSKKTQELKSKIGYKFYWSKSNGKSFKESVIKDKGSLKYIEFKVGAEETIDFKVEVSNLQKEEIKGEIRVPFEFITTRAENIRIRKHKYLKEFPGTGSFGGFTMILRGGHSDIQGIVKLNNGKPAGNYKVMAISQEGDIKFETSTKANGSFLFRQLGYGIYSLAAFKEKKTSFPADVIVSAKSAKERIAIFIR